MSQVPPVPPQKSAEPSAMAQCSITGIWVPADELIMFQGRPVSAEGKQIMLDRMMAGDPVDATVTRPSVLRRFGCLFLDGLVLLIPTWIVEAIFVVMVVLMNGRNMFGSLSNGGQNSLVLIFMRLIYLAVCLLYISYFAVMHALEGQTVGKMAGHLRVVNLDGSAISRRTAWIRGLAFGVPTLSLGVPMVIFGGILPAYFASVLIGVFGLFGFIWLLADYICALVDTRMQRSLHDRIAGTRVIWLNA